MPGAGRTAVLATIAITGAYAQAPDTAGTGQSEGTFTGEGYFEQKDEGWFWKVPVPVEAELEPAAEPDPPAQPPAPPPPARTEPLPPATPVIAERPAGPQPLSAAWLRDALPRYRDRALDNPTPENVAAFFYLQRYSVDMAERFALQAQRVVMSDPVLDENSRRPLSMFGADVVDAQAAEASDRAVEIIADQAGLWYFYRSDCPYCKAQNPVLTNFQRKVDMAIMPIALDNAPMEDGHFPDWVENGGQAEMLQVRATPTLYLVRPPGEFLLVSEGVVAESALRERMIQMAHQAGWISDEVFDATRAVNRIYLAGDFANVPEETLEDPARLIELLRASTSIGTMLP